MSQTVSPSTSRCYGLARVSRAWNVPRAGVYRFLKGTPSPAIARRPGPRGPCPDADLADLIRREIEASDFHGEGYRKIWARLRVAGVRSSPRRVRRVMGENGLLAPHRVGRNQEKTHDGTIVTDKVNEMWGTDMSQTVTLEQGRAYVFVAVEHANSEIIGIHAARSANRFEALEPVRQGVHRCFGSIAPGVARGLKLRHDHGSNYMSGDFQDEIKCLGIEASPSFVREPEGNGVAERFIRTLKENLLWVRTFKTIEELRAELVAFASATMKLGSSRGMDTKRPRGSERSKPRHELRLTRPSQPPYPWPPEQAQPRVSKPCRTTIRARKIAQDRSPLGDFDSDREFSRGLLYFCTARYARLGSIPTLQTACRRSTAASPRITNIEPERRPQRGSLERSILLPKSPPVNKKWAFEGTSPVGSGFPAKFSPSCGSGDQCTEGRAKTPIPHDAEMYKWRHLIENFVQRIKEFRRIATRYDTS